MKGTETENVQLAFGHVRDALLLGPVALHSGEEKRYHILALRSKGILHSAQGCLPAGTITKSRVGHSIIL